MTDAQTIGRVLGAEADERSFCTEWDAIVVELNAQLDEPIPHRFKPTRAFRQWEERVVADVWEKGWIMQWYQHIEPRSGSYRGNGKKTALTDHEVQVLHQVLSRRVSQGRCPRVTPTQADQGAQWLDANWRRYKLPNLEYLKIDRFEFRGCELIHEAHTGFADYATFVPKYRAVWSDGSYLTYAVGSWQSDRNREVRWSGVTAAGRFMEAA